MKGLADENVNYLLIFNCSIYFIMFVIMMFILHKYLIKPINTLNRLIEYKEGKQGFGTSSEKNKLLQQVHSEYKRQSKVVNDDAMDEEVNEIKGLYTTLLSIESNQKQF